MKIQSFHAENMHGYLTFGFKLNPELTFLTGINGSGKTSTVRAITALLTPSFRDLALMNYDTMEVTVEVDGKPISVSATRNEDEVAIQCSGVKKAINLPILKSEAHEPHSQYADSVRRFYRERESIESKSPVMGLIDSLPTPMFLDLERRQQEGVRMRRVVRHGVGRDVPSNPLSGSILDGLADARVLAEREYRRYLVRRTELADTLKQNILLSAFELSEGPRPLFEKPKSQLIRTLKKSEEVVHDSLPQIGISEDQIEAIVDPFFKQVREVIGRLPSPKSLEKPTFQIVQRLQEWSAIQPKISHIDRIVSLVDRYNAELLEAYLPIKRYLESANLFIGDSNKTLAFDSSANLRVAIEGDDALRPITALSSGERQVVVILTHLAFNPRAKEANVLIIDEPELSLHIKWQELFVDQILEASPGIQLILATHSPSIIKGRVENCIDVEEAKHGDRLLG